MLIKPFLFYVHIRHLPVFSEMYLVSSYYSVFYQIRADKEKKHLNDNLIFSM